MARITVEDCLEKIDSQYDLVLLAKERTAQLNAGEKTLVPQDNDKNTVISLREIGEGKISIKNIEDAAINKLRKVQSAPEELDDLEFDQDDDFDKIYKGEISKSGAAILPSKRVRKIPEKTAFKSSNEEKSIEEKIKETEQKVQDELKSVENESAEDKPE
ncbi:DNA-directed RNA polymerase subunit omega [Pelagibacteraceae bacterium]|nr:DNA-directed RNA polymerase subunit omega [Pelagibacteraceae bacterium]